jgi:site-specific DNA recombinase
LLPSDAVALAVGSAALLDRGRSRDDNGRVVKPTNPKASLRCAVYTRVSTEHGLEQEFNSLDNQREASEAYIKSQAHEGWRLMRDRYDDGGFSGGSMERPALKKLLEAVRARRIDVIVVYKVDRLTRSLADFAKLVELFDEHRVSFVSVTQAFNTTTSMGRLTLNVLLSFAQFEREVTSERIRDKIAASKKKGIWMGGVVPLGYRVDNRALHVVEEHAAFVRDLFRRYLETGSVVRLKAALDQENVRVPVRTDGKGKATGGGLISRGHLYKILSNPIYVGRLTHKDQVHEGLHAPIVDHESWSQVQRQLAEHTQDRAGPRLDSDALLAGKLFDDRGNQMSLSHATKRGRRYRYYISRAILQGPKDDVGSVARVPAVDLERRVVDAVRAAAPANLRERSLETEITHRASFRSVAIDSAAVGSSPCVFDPGADLHAAVERITIRRTLLEIELIEAMVEDPPGRILIIPWTPPSPYRRREIIQGEGGRSPAMRPMRAEARALLIDALRDAHCWQDELIRDPSCTIASIAAREKKTERSIRMTLSLSFLSPALVKAAVEARLSRGFGVKRLMDLPIAWSDQWSPLGLQASPQT